MSDEETTEETPVEEAPVEETAAEESAPAEDAPAAEAPAADATEGDGEEQEAPTAKQLRKRARAAHAGEAKPARTAEERKAERAEERRTKAASRRRWRARQKAKRAAAGPGTPTAPAAKEPGALKVRQGIVVSDRAEKTITVRIDVARRHPKYEKIVRSSQTLHAHDESNDAHIGDTVRVIECRPMSRTKRWRLDEVLERAK